jgi:predicted metal-dependent hydrolase
MKSSNRDTTAAAPSQLSLFTEFEFDAGVSVLYGVGNPDPGADFPGSSGVSGHVMPAAAASAAPGVPAIFRHPQAEREIRLHEHVVAYALRRAKRRSIGFMVSPEGLSVNAPKWVGVGDIETALREKSTWILRKLREQQERSQRLQATKIDWRDGATLPYLGENIVVVLDPRAGVNEDGAVLNTDSSSGPHSQQSPLVGLPQLTLHIGLPHTATALQIRDAVQSWLQRQAKRVFADRCHHFAAQLGVRFTRLSLSSAQTRWGSASADGSIRLNWRLIHFALSTIDYVVTHELAHLREMNHSPRFWDVVRSVMPDYEQVRDKLKDDTVPMFD